MLRLDWLTSEVRRPPEVVAWVLLCAAFSSIAFASSFAQATPAALFGAGPESQAQGATGVSYARGHASTYINPAGLSRVPRKAFAFGVQAVNFSLRAEPNQGATLNDEAHSILFGVTAPLPFPEPVADRVVLGLSVSSPGAAIARVAILNETRPQFPLLAPRADALNFNVGLGVRLPWGLRLGVGTGLLASLRGSIAIDSGGEAARSVTDDELVLTQAPVVGLEYAPNDALSVGLVLRGALESAFDLEVTVDNLGQLVVPPLNVTGVAGFDPSEVNLEGSYRWRSWHFAAGLGRRAWGQLDSLREATVRCPAEEPDCGAPGPHTLALRDTWVPRVALSRTRPLTRHTELQLRAGYFFEPSPLPAQTGSARVFDNPRHALTTGYAIRFRAPLPPIELQFAAQWHHLSARRHQVAQGGRNVELETGGQILAACWTVGGEF
jgi:long-subunit fatty acid transport protein